MGAWGEVDCCGSERTYGVLFLDVELEVDGAGAGGCYAELCG